MSQPPAPEKTKIRFVRGFEPKFPIPKTVKTAGLTHRFAVIQETWRADTAATVGMFFDEALWRRLLAFAAQFAPGLRLAILPTQNGKEMPPEDFLAAWDKQDADAREPPAILARDARQSPVLYIEPEYWTRVGGPMPYHDSYTYSIYSSGDLGDRVMRFLTEAEAARGWELSTVVLKPGDDGL